MKKNYVLELEIKYYQARCKSVTGTIKRWSNTKNDPYTKIDFTLDKSCGFVQCVARRMQLTVDPP